MQKKQHQLSHINQGFFIPQLFPYTTQQPTPLSIDKPSQGQQQKRGRFIEVCPYPPFGFEDFAGCHAAGTM